MHDEKRKPGRPSTELDTRHKLIGSARDLFTALSYDKVSTRLIAKKAGVNSSMIRYYFSNKEGLFETMLRETIEPMRLKVQALLLNSNRATLFEIMRTYYQEMLKIPHFPRLLMQVMLLPPSDVQHQLTKKVFFEVSGPMHGLVFERLHAQGAIREDVDPRLFRMSFISLMVFPFIMPPATYELHDMEMNEDFLMALFEHNIKLLQHGLFN